MGITDPRFDDAYLLRFLRARKFDLVKTKEMWTNFIKWREENNVDQIGVTIASVSSKLLLLPEQIELCVQ